MIRVNKLQANTQNPLKRLNLKNKAGVEYLILLTISTIANYLLPSALTSLFFIIILILYSRSNREPFWLAYFLALSEGFFGFFGRFEATISILPGLPAIEIAQFYIAITLVKAVRKKRNQMFYDKHLRLLFLYILILIIWGVVIGIEGSLNVYFRILKLTFPMLLLYSLPALLTKYQDFEALFRLVFLICITSIITQFFNIIVGMNPAEIMNFKQLSSYSENYIEGTQGYRGFYNPNGMILGFFGALFYLNTNDHKFHEVLLHILVFAIFITVILSATRGWIIGFGSIMIGNYLLLQGFKKKRIAKQVLLIFGIFLLLTMIPKVNSQLDFSKDRLGSIESIVEGDLSAEGTLSRIDERSPKVINMWLKKPLLGWGFSSVFFEYTDGHVGNQNILLNAGIIGAVILALFFARIVVILYKTGKTAVYLNSFKRNQYQVFIIFLFGWLIIHSTSGQQFAFYSFPDAAIVFSVFISFAGWNFAWLKSSVLIDPVYARKNNSIFQI